MPVIKCKHSISWPISKISLTTLLSMTENSVVTLNRTDTTHDLSQKAKSDKNTEGRSVHFIVFDCPKSTCGFDSARQTTLTINLAR